MNTLFSITLTPEELQIISDGLQHMPLGKAGPLVQKINKQIQQASEPVVPEVSSD